MQYMRIFREKGEDFNRYWASVSTEKVDKDGKGTGKYARANIPVRLSKDAEEVFKKNKEKSKTDGITHLNVKAVDFWLKAITIKDNDDDEKDILIAFLNKIEPVAKEDDD